MNKYFLAAIIVAIVAGIGVLLLAGGGIFWASQDSPGLDEGPIPADNTPPADEEQVATEFAERMQEKVVADIGQPIEGFEPSMFLQVYAGLQDHDFDNVEAMGGTYKFGSGGLEYQEHTGGVQTSADQAINDRGMKTLLDNIASRLEISLQSQTALQDIFTSLELQAQNNGQPGQEIMLAGEIVCLPHKDTSGPVTLECAFGLQTADGTHYGLRNLEQSSPPGTIIDTGIRVQVTGTSTDPSADNIYDIAAVIEIDSIEEL